MIEFIAADLEINVPINQLLNMKNWQFIDVLFQDGKLLFDSWNNKSFGRSAGG